MCPAPEQAPIDRYVVLEYLAEGGMGAIYLGKKMGAGGFEKQVVLKQLLPEFTRQPEFIDLFLREARLSATLDHANIIHTIDLVTAGQEYFIVMEYLDGADLRTLLKKSKKRRRRFSAAAGIYVARELLSALAYAHNKVGPDGTPIRLIHRDISPSNILISGNGEVKLTDFGIAKASTHNSMFYRVKGKVGYMSPEQAGSEHLDARSDLYSLAVCLYEIITGERLFVNVGITTSAEEMYGQPIPLLSHKVPGLPSEIDKVLLKALSRDPDHRFQTAGEFQEALLRCAHRHGLMMSAPELADHLGDVCGDPENWRDDHGDSQRGAGTELYDAYDHVEGTEQIDVSGVSEAILSDSDVISMSVEGSQVLDPRGKKRERQKTSITKLSELKGIELTSMINMAGGTDEGGANPLVDFGDLSKNPSLPSMRGKGRPAASAASETPLEFDESTGFVVGHAAPAKAPPRSARQTGAPSGGRGESTGIVVGAGGGRRPEPQPSAERAWTQTPPAVLASRRPARSATGLFAALQRPWLILVLILLAGLGTAAIIGLSGPTIDSPDRPLAPAPAAGGNAVGGPLPAPR